MIKFLAITFSVLIHFLLLSLAPSNAEKPKVRQEKISIKLNRIPVRKIGLEKVKDNDNLFGKMAYSRQDIVKTHQEVKQKSSAISKEETQNPEKKKQELIKRNQFAQKRIMNEAMKSVPWSNELQHVKDAGVSFIPPKGISPDKLNELEKVFYAFYKRVAIQYINSIQISVRNKVNERPYLKGTLREAPPQQLKAVVRYDELGNAEIVKILSSSKNDDIHNIFDEALQKMNKIPNIVKDLKDEDGKYYAIFMLSINSNR